MCSECTVGFRFGLYLQSHVFDSRSVKSVDGKPTSMGGQLYKHIQKYK